MLRSHSGSAVTRDAGQDDEPASDAGPAHAEGTHGEAPNARAIVSPGFAKLFLGLLLCFVNVNLFGLIPYYLELRGVSELLYGSAAGMLGLGGVAAMVVLGGRADQRSRRVSILRYLTAPCAANVLALAAMDVHPGWYLAALGLQGVLAGVGIPVIFVWASELCPPTRRTEAFAWLGIAGLLGDSLGPLLGESLLLTQPDPRAPSAFVAVFVAANVLWALSVLCFLATPNVIPATGDTTREGLSGLLRRAELRWALSTAVAFGGALGVMMNLGKNFVASLDLQFVSVLLGGHTVGALMVRLALPWVLARFDRLRLIPLGFAGVALSMVALTLTHGYGLLAISGLVYGVSHGILFPTLFARLIDFGGTEAAGRISTLYMGVFSLGFGLWPAIGGPVLRVASFPALFGIVALACVAAIALHRKAERCYVRRAPEA